MDGGKPVVVITGISGYIGAHVGLKFLADGGFKVRGTVRNKSNPEKIEPLKKAFGTHFDQLELVEADLLDDASMQKAMEGATYIVHVASPFHFNIKTEDDLIKPAVNGTLSAMKAAHANKVKRVVVTSSVAAISTNLGKEDMANPRNMFNEDDWSDENCGAYPKSKTLAEKAAWDFVKNLPEAERFELCTVNPGLVTGPNLNTADFTSGNIIKGIMLGTSKGIFNSPMPITDVRDVAEMHLRAIKVKEAPGHRYISITDSPHMKDLMPALVEKFGNNGYPNITTAENPDDGKDPWVGKTKRWDTSPAQRILGIRFTDLKVSLIDMVNAMIETGYLPDQRINK